MPDIVIDTSQVVCRVPADAVGINLDYLRDHNANRPTARPIQEALREMGVRWLRYPGGGKSDCHLWSKPPWTRPDPQVFKSYREFQGDHKLLDFDAFVAYARDVGAEPFVVVGCKPEEHTGISKERYLENAVEWVRYANVRKGYGVRYWEIGNENWMNQVIEPGEMAKLVREFSAAMKAVDPSIRIGSNGFNRDWWEAFLPTAASHLDFLTLSNYPCSCWMGYEYYRTHGEVELVEQVKFAAEAIAACAPEDRDRLSIIVTELNSMDYGENGWPNRNNLGHALVTVEIFARALQVPGVRAAMLWNTRWVDPEPETIWYGLGTQNEILPSGRAVAVWAQFLHDTFVACERTETLVTWATRSSATGALSVFLTNKDTTDTEVNVTIRPGEENRRARVFRFQGSGPDDMHPVWEEGAPVEVRDNAITSLSLPGVSLTILCVEP